MSACFLCNEIGEWANWITDATMSMLSKILNVDLVLEQNSMCDNCHSIIYDYELFELKLEALHKRINSMYSATAYVRQHSVALNPANSDELVIANQKIDLNDVIMVYENVVDGDLIEEELSDGGHVIENVSEFIEEEMSQELLLNDQNSPDLKPPPVSTSDLTQPFADNGQFFVCKLCNPSDDSINAVEYDRHTMELHLRTEHGKSIFISSQFEEGQVNRCDYLKCDYCDLTFDKAETKKFKAHKRSHLSQGVSATSSKNHACNTCDKKFGSAKLLDEHENLHSGARPFSCAYCSKDFTSKYTLATHLKIHSNRPRPFKCDLCPKAFLTSHNLAHHKNLHSNIKSYVCDVCQKSFATDHNLSVHKIVHKDFKPFICRWPDCGKSFARRNEIKDHERIHTGEKPFKCELCGIRFSQRSNLLSHKKATHLNEKPHACQECGKAFKRRRLLDYHIKACHTGERPFKCETCAATFVYPEHFKKHKRNSCGNKKQGYGCEICGRYFLAAGLLADHRREEHPEKSPTLKTLTKNIGGVKRNFVAEKSQAPISSTINKDDLGSGSYIIVDSNFVTDTFEDDGETIEMINEEDLIVEEAC